MAKISTYVIDGSIVDDDKVIGSDANDSMITKNYKVGDLISYFAASIGNDYLVPYLGANDDVDLGSFSLSGYNVQISNSIIAGGTQGAAGQVLMSQGPGQPTVWAFNAGSQGLNSVLNIGNTSVKNIQLSNAFGSAIIDVEKIYGNAAIYLSDLVNSFSSYWKPNVLHLQDANYSVNYNTNKIRYQLGGNFVDLVPNNYNNQTFSFPTNGGVLPVSVNGVFANSSGDISIQVSGGSVTSVELSAGTGIGLSGTNPITTSGIITVTNTAPDQLVTLTAGTGISIAGTYPNFTIGATGTSASTLQDVLNAGNTAYQSLGAYNFQLGDNFGNNASFLPSSIILSDATTLSSTLSAAGLSVYDSMYGTGMYNNNTIQLFNSTYPRNFVIDNTGSETILNANYNYYHFPLLSGFTTGLNYTLPISVNGQYADPDTGDITISAGSQNLQQVTDVGNITTNFINITPDSLGGNIYFGRYTGIFTNSTELINYELGSNTRFKITDDNVGFDYIPNISAQGLPGGMSASYQIGIDNTTYDPYIIFNAAGSKTISIKHNQLYFSDGAGATLTYNLGAVTNSIVNFPISVNGVSAGADGNINISTGSGTVTSVQLAAGTGISLSGTNPITTSGTITVTNSSPDQTVVLTAGTGISTSGTYPNFTITNSNPFTSPLTTKGDIYVRNGSADTRLPVGLDTQILIADSSTTTGLKWGSNTTPPASGYYGQYFDYNIQTATTNNIGVAMIFGTVDLSNGVTVVTDGTNLTKITFANTGVYNLQFSTQFQNLSNAPQDVYVWLRKNGTTGAADVVGSTGVVGMEARKNPGDPYHTIVTWNYLLNVVGGDYYQLVWATTDVTNVQINYYASTANHPSTASTLFTATQQSGILAGTGVTAINSLTGAVQTLNVGTSGTDFGISSSGTSHTFNLPTASSANRGALSSTDWSTFNGKQAALSGTGFVKVSGTTVSYDNSTYYLASNPSGFTSNTGTVTSVAALTLGTSGTDISSTVATGTTTPVITLNVPDASATARGVITTGTQTIAGAKTLSSLASFSAGINVTPPTGSGSTVAGVIVSGSNTNGGTSYVDFLKATNTAVGATNINKWFRLNSTGGLEIINSAYTTTLFTLTDAGALTTASTVNGASPTEMGYLSGVTSAVQTQINGKQTDSVWVDASTQSITGWSATTTKLIQYKLLGSKTAILMWEIVGTGTGSTASLTLPFTSSSWGNQYAMYDAVQSTTSVGVCTVGASSTTLNFYPTATQGANWTTGQARNLRGQMIINLA